MDVLLCFRLQKDPSEVFPAWQYDTLTNTSHASGWHGRLEDYFPLQTVGFPLPECTLQTCAT